jgi:hypothetical protein
MAGPRLTLLVHEREAAEIERKKDIVSKLNVSGALDVRGGSVTLHFDADGHLRKIDRNDTLLRS